MIGAYTRSTFSLFTPVLMFSRLTANQRFRHPEQLPHDNTPGTEAPAGHRLLWHQSEVTLRNVIRRFNGDLVSYQLREDRLTHWVKEGCYGEVISLHTTINWACRIRPLGGITFLDATESVFGNRWINKPADLIRKWHLRMADELGRYGINAGYVLEEEMAPSHTFSRIAPTLGSSIAPQYMQVGGSRAVATAGGQVHGTLFDLRQVCSDPAQILTLHQRLRTYTYGRLGLFDCKDIEREGKLETRYADSRMTTPEVPRKSGRERESTGKAPAEPTISYVKWIDDGCRDEVSEMRRSQCVKLTAFVENPTRSTVKFIIRRQDGKNVEKGRPEIRLSASVDCDGYAETGAITRKEIWLDAEKGDLHRLIVRAEHDAASKESAPIELIPPPKVITLFRPNSNWKGEFGFDWIRTGDTKLFADNNYERIVSKHYRDPYFTILETNGNEPAGFYKNDPAQLLRLRKRYKQFAFEWNRFRRGRKEKVRDYVAPWMSLYKGRKAKLQMLLDIEDEADYLEFAPNDNFAITPSTIELTGKRGKVNLGDLLEIECLQEFDSDQAIDIYACQKLEDGSVYREKSGSITVWGNGVKRRKEQKVVFVQVHTPPISTKLGLVPKASPEKDRIEKYLNQAYIKLHDGSSIVTLDLRSEKSFLDYVLNGKVSSWHKDGKESLDGYLKDQLAKAFKDKYENHFKAFYFAEAGFNPRTGTGLNGYSRFGADYVVVFPTANEQTAAHEFLHSLNLSHSFTNTEAEEGAEFTYTFKKTENIMDYTHNVPGHKNDRCQLWRWQWERANKSINP